MAGVFECGFARVAVKVSFQEVKSKDKAKKYERYLSFFEDEYKENFAVTQKTFTKRSTILLKMLKNWAKSEDKPKYMEHFSSKSWAKLSLSQKAAHTATNCRACEVYHQPFQNTFPVKCQNIKKRTAVSVGLQELNKLKKLKPATQAQKKEVLSDWYDKCNGAFQEVFHSDINEGLVKLPHLKIQPKKSAAQLKKERRQRDAEQKKTVEEHWTAMDVKTFLGTRQSFSQRDQQRKALFFESPEQARQRSEKRKVQEEAGECVPKRHSPDPSTIDFDKNALLEEVNNMNDGEKVSTIPQGSQAQF